jgi:lysophospholipase L1-like esterase
MSQKSILCLGDSYTIGEGVPLFESFPYLLVQALRQSELSFAAPEIVAKTGFTTDELLQQINKTILLNQYHYATVLIGVNNQYRGYSIEVFEQELKVIIEIALQKVNNQSKKVIVLSIPNWGVTPFAKDRNEQQITQEIHAYNAICNKVANQLNCNFIDITPQTELAKLELDLLTTDALHYSKKSHQVWAAEVANKILLQEK